MKKRIIYCLTCKDRTPHYDAPHHSGEILAQCEICGTWKPASIREQRPLRYGDTLKKNPIGSGDLLPEGATVRVNNEYGTVINAKYVTAHPSGVVALHKIKFTHRRRRKFGQNYVIEKIKPVIREVNYSFIEPVSENEFIEKDRYENPVPLSRETQKKKAELLYQNFTGHEPGDHVVIDKPDYPDVMSVIGDIDGILYTTVRDGVTEKYIHRFKKNSRPLFCVSPDGLSIHVIGGQYEFGERGIIDK